ncbi:hypothetical protein AAZX31_16G087000 [Glycine max]|uniref:Ycf3-interacting protein 1, chloroplastic n=2 Tax=Glycine subgen. Soja TaxID=1462606 RepID=C6TA24_SOYBN|nr:Ycf3-interacting protein 1, chloroplastic-like [Glycine max]XP_028205473.1 ycf3-interacting protein 1, chloroplastic-like isoform X1 [Glycine soja]ACU18676.1 unknown [Glycine max]KAG4938747.1 hypothetical protein JHK86_044888 [Glycine max]KAG4940865.1 hypothetical protein JHK87_044736 [Glycine soja]KAG5108091.1 hypothetical protein JHK84_044998 [Glycine max]KAH1150692.1 hypothetical protein GYH30_044617 [Glycine max]|eukprot:NP_001241562.1 uncharacterized protein LOC100816881 [Glycine max]
MAWSLTLPPPSSLSSSSSPSFPTFHHHHHSLFFNGVVAFTRLRHRRNSNTLSHVPSVGKEDTDLRVSSLQEQQLGEDDDGDDEPTPQDIEYVAQIKRVLELLRKNRDMLFGEVKLTIMIEDPREVERRRLLGIEDLDGPTREDLVDALDEINEGKIPKDRASLQMLAEELASWPNLEDAVPKKKPSKSLYAKATDTGIDPELAAKKLNIDWDSAAEIEETNADDETEVPSVVGYGALYLVSAFPIIIGISVVLILFYNSLQ